MKSNIKNGTNDDKRGDFIFKWISFFFSGATTLLVTFGIFALNAKIEMVVKRELQSYVSVDRYQREMNQEVSRTDALINSTSGNRDLLIRMDERLKLLQEQMGNKKPTSNP